MNQSRIGEFLKELRKEKGLTQEQLAEHFNVSGRTVSRWETGTNMPDLSLIVELSDFYDVDIREIFNGQRRVENMDEEMKDTLKQAAEYSRTEKKDMRKRTLLVMLVSYAFIVLNTILGFLEYRFKNVEFLEYARFFTLGFLLVTMAFTIAYLSGWFEKHGCGKTTGK